MRKENFARNSPGHLVSLDSEGPAFVPNPLPPRINWEGKLLVILSEAERSIGELNGVGRRLPNPYLFTRPFVSREAVLSSRIEGIQASLADLYALEAQTPLFEEKRRADAEEVRNYVLALEHGLESELPISNRLLREMHGILMQGVRGRNRSPGQFRKSQNWIGPPGAKRRDATYVPPPPGPILEGCLSDLEKFINAENDLPPLVEIALVHYQFEAIHPFLDGNGRIGRLLITLMLLRRGLLSQPLLHLSAYFERHRSTYYEGLLGISQRGAWEEWLAFFLRGVAEEAQDATAKAQRLLDQQQRWRQTYQSQRATANLFAALDYLVAQPVLTARQLERKLNVTFRSAQKIIDRLKADGILQEVTGKSRNRLYFCQPILDIIERGEESAGSGDREPAVETGF